MKSSEKTPRRAKIISPLLRMTSQMPPNPEHLRELAKSNLSPVDGVPYLNKTLQQFCPTSRKCL
jgi:hypothetical protein